MFKYQKTFLFIDEAIVKSITQLDDHLIAKFDETIFYPGGGGQPHDFGTVENDNFNGKVTKVQKKDGKVFHTIKIINGTLNENDKVTLKIDEKRRIKISRAHTGEHILYKSMEKIIPDIEMVKVDLDPDEPSIFVKCKELTWEQLFKAEKLANEIIKEKREVIKHIITHDELDDWQDKVRIKLHRIKDDKIRIIEVKDYDWSACAGTHGNDSSFVGSIFITKFNLVKGNWDIRFTVDVEEPLYEYSKITRLVSEKLVSDIKSIPDEITRLQKESQNYKIKFREISSKLLEHNTEEKINKINFIYNTIEEVEKKQLIDKSSKLAKEKTIVCFLNIIEDKTTVLLNISKDLNIDAPKILNELLAKFNGKGGGRDNFAMGSIDSKFIDKFINSTKEFIKNI